MPRELILHIGLSKTGSSSIQLVLAAQRDALAAQGVFYPRSPGWENHMLLPASIVADPNALWNVHPGTWEGLRPEARLAQFREQFNAEMDAMPEMAARCVISSEQCGSMLNTDDEVARLAALLRRWFDPIRVVVYLRRQDKHAASAYTQNLRVGILAEPALPEGGPGQLIQYDYGTLLDRWARGFGDGAIVPRIFERADMKGGDAVQDFLDIAGISLPALDDNPDRLANPSVTLEGQALLRMAGRALEAQGGDRPWRDSPAWRRLTACITEAMPGRGWTPTRGEAADFMARFADTNEHARARFFPDRATLFPDNYADLPATQPAIPTEQIAAAALAALMHETGAGAKRQAEAAMAQYRLHKRLGEKGPVRANLIRAVRFDPDLLIARLCLAEFFIEEGDLRQAKEHAEAALRIAPENPKAARLDRLARGEKPAKAAVGAG
jgi:tetratricopeptide (TPR) repeat protein